MISVISINKVMKTLLILFSAILLHCPLMLAEHGSTSDETYALSKVTTSFSVEVEHNSSPVSGAKVSVLQKQKLISSGTTIRGKARLYVDDVNGFVIKVEADGFKLSTKQIKTITQGESIKIALEK